MADNIGLNAGSGGATIRTDDDGTAHWQYVKLAYGADNTQNIVTSTTTNPLPVALSDTDNAVLDTMVTALQLIDNAVSGAGFNITQLGGAAVPIGAGLEATALRVTIATDSTGVVSIDDNGGAITVDGTVTANLSATDNAVLDAIAASVAGTLTVGSHAVTNAGTFATQIDGSALTSLQLIDDSIFADDAAFTLASSKVTMSGAIRDDSLSALTAVEGDAVPLRVNSTGALHVTGGGGGTQYNIDDAAGGADTGTLLLAVRDDSLTTLTPVDGDYVQLRVNSTGALHVTGGGGGTEYTEDVATANPIVGTATMMERDDALSTLTPIEGDWAAMRCSAEGALWVQEFNSDAILADTANMDTNLATIAGAVAGTEIQVDIVSGNVTNAGTFAVQVDGAALTALQLIDDTVYSEDATTPATIVGNAIVMERDDALATVTPIEGDWIGLRGTAEGALWTQDFNSDTMLSHLATLAGAVGGTEIQVDLVSANVTNAGTFAVQVDGNALTALQLIDNSIVAHDAAASGSTGVSMIGGYATNSIEGITQVANADASHIVTDLNGVLVTRNMTTLEELLSTSQSVTATTSTAATNFGVGGAGIHNYVSKCTVWNSSATDTHVKIQDGSGGTTLWVVPAPAGGGAVEVFDPPLKQATANTALYFAANDAATTVYVSFNGFQAQG